MIKKSEAAMSGPPNLCVFFSLFNLPFFDYIYIYIYLFLVSVFGPDKIMLADAML